jgi:hypothetical protein
MQRNLVKPLLIEVPLFDRNRIVYGAGSVECSRLGDGATAVATAAAPAEGEGRKRAGDDEVFFILKLKQKIY